LSLLLLFLDGVGLGDASETNPLHVTPTPHLDAWLGAGWEVAATSRVALDANLEAPGLPQSATGQAALLTGLNAAEVMNGHYGPWPGPTLRRLLDGGTLIGDWAGAAGSSGVVWANAYPPGYFDVRRSGRLKPSAMTYAAESVGVELPGLEVYADGRAFAPDLDGAAFHNWGADPPGGFVAGPKGAERAGERLARHAAGQALTVLDVWTTDRAGHKADLTSAARLVERLDAFIGGVLTAAPHGLQVVLTSDHGNLEACDHGRHTRAPVPFAVFGGNLSTRPASLTDVRAVLQPDA
jgi:hypothetical protein